MAIRTGIVGLPNVGKSTLFNALCAGGAAAENRPFCTIEPNVGVVPVPDPRLEAVRAVYGSKEAISATRELVDIAGLVRGASKGEGLGNRFLGEIREVDAILHVVRCFSDGAVVHVDGSVGAVRDAEVVEIELGLRDLDSVEKRREKAEKQTKAAGREGADARAELDILVRLARHLSAGEPASSFEPDHEDSRRLVADLFLLTNKPVLYIANVDEDEALGGESFAALEAHARSLGRAVIPVAARIEAELIELPEQDRQDYLESLGLSETGLIRVMRGAYRALSLLTFFTANLKEARAWTIVDGLAAPQAAGCIHSDFERGFIRAEVIHYDDLAELGSEPAARQAGRMRSEGREYQIRDGDVVLFRFNV